MLASRDPIVAERVQEYWSWAAVALFLLITVDLLTTMYAAAVVGIEFEANPLVRWALSKPIGLLVGLNLVVTVLAVLAFQGLMRTYKVVPSRVRPVYGLLIELWLGALVAAGLFVFANNLSVIVLGKSLL